jgi:hypothetical protein
VRVIELIKSKKLYQRNYIRETIFFDVSEHLAEQELPVGHFLRRQSRSALEKSLCGGGTPVFPLGRLWFLFGKLTRQEIIYFL